MVRLIAAAALALALSSPVLAGQCPSDIRKIDAALAANASLPPSIRDAVRTLRDTGERLHKAGKHGESVETLGNAKQILAKAGVKVD